jgi:hypothetical protein
MYLHAPKAVREHIEYDKMADGRWRAAFKGAFGFRREPAAGQAAKPTRAGNPPVRAGGGCHNCQAFRQVDGRSCDFAPISGRMPEWYGACHRSGPEADRDDS